MRVIVAGSRDFNDYGLLKSVLDTIENIDSIVCGMAHGVDLLGKKWADENKIPVSEFPADWNRYKKKAGHIRNWEMAKNADCLICFWNGESPGSRSMINIASQFGLSGIVIDYVTKTYKEINKKDNTLY